MYFLLLIVRYDFVASLVRQFGYKFCYPFIHPSVRPYLSYTSSVHLSICPAVYLYSKFFRCDVVPFLSLPIHNTFWIHPILIIPWCLFGIAVYFKGGSCCVRCDCSGERQTESVWYRLLGAWGRTYGLLSLNHNKQSILFHLQLSSEFESGSWCWNNY